MFAAASKYWPGRFYSVEQYKYQVHDELLAEWFPAKRYDTPRKRAMCLRKLNRSGIRVVKVKVTPIGG